MTGFDVAFLLEDTSISGIASLVLSHADALAARGHRVTVWSTDSPVTWRGARANWRQVDDLRESTYRSDVVVATSASSLVGALDPDARQPAALFYAHTPDSAERLAVTRAFDTLGRSFRYSIASSSRGPGVPPEAMIVDEEFFKPRPQPVRLRVLLTGVADEISNGIDTAYAAVVDARWHGYDFELVRISRWAPSASEPADQFADELHVAVSHQDVARIVSSCDLVLCASGQERGLRVSVAEAFAAGLAPVMLLAESSEDDDDSPGHRLGAELRRLLDDDDARSMLSARVRRLAEAFRPAEAAARFERFLETVVRER